MSIMDTLITDRTQADVDAGNAKGSYNAEDLNRVGSAMNYVADRLRAAQAETERGVRNATKPQGTFSAQAAAALRGGQMEQRMLTATQEIERHTKRTAELLKNLFYNKAPLHDGAVVIADGRIAAAGCILPLSGKQNISKDLGTRHRAGLGQSENYDSLSVIVSEETGGISLAEGGILKQHLAPETLERLLTAKLMPEEDDQKPNLLERVKGWISK